jgi:hypothetical protein
MPVPEDTLVRLNSAKRGVRSPPLQLLRAIANNNFVERVPGRIQVIARCVDATHGPASRAEQDYPSDILALMISRCHQGWSDGPTGIQSQLVPTPASVPIVNWPISHTLTTATRKRGSSSAK